MILYLYSEKKYDVKKCLSHYAVRKNLSLNDAQIYTLKIVKGAHGKPYFKSVISEKTDENANAVKFSVSHSGQYWACLMSDEEIGLDIEDVSYRLNNSLKAQKVKKYEAISKRFFTENEHEFVVKNGINGFFDVWVRKEAYVKYTGRGLALGLDTFSVVDENGELKSCKEPIDGAIIQEVDFKFFCKNLKGAFCAKTWGSIEDIIVIK